MSEARTLPPDERLRFVREACADDSEMYARAMSRMPWSEDASRDELFDPGGQEDRPEPAAGQSIGPYRLIRSLGQGGMGHVFLAERADQQFRQHVAIKIVRSGVLSRQIQSRLRQERQILASLDHPNIARLYDGGATEDGAPYIVMEYIDGEPLDVYCDSRRLSVKDRLKLFVTVCAAVHRAHQSLIVHRDLKPSNILVTKEGVPKLLDFGIAKMLDERAAMHTLAVTQIDVRVMTPDHASPEQIRGEPITTASDTYVLGVLLYELLCGRKPFAVHGARLAELEHAICETTPSSLSSVIATGIAGAPARTAEIAAARGVSPGRLRRELRGDLDNIVAMAMRKEPDRRYASVAQFAADIENYMNGLPIRARPDAWTYRTTKFVKRHAALVAVSAASILLLLVFAVTTYVQAQRIAFERDAAEEQRSRAESERERAEAVSAFLIDSFRLADPSQSRGDAITAREILDGGARRISRELRRQPDLQAALLDTIGSVYLSLGLPTQAQPLVEQGLAIRRALNEHGVEVARSLYSLSLVHEKRGDLDAAEMVARDSLDMARRLTGENSLQTSDCLCRLAYVARQRGALGEAEQLFNQCLNVRIALLGERHEKISVPLDNIALIAQERGDYVRAEKLLLQALAIDRRTRGEDHPQYLAHLFHLALLAEDKGDLAQANKLYTDAVQLYRRVLGPEHPETIDVMSAMGYFLMQADRLSEAEQMLTDVLTLNTRLRGAEHAYVGNDLENLGRLALRRGQAVQAEERFNEALAIYRRTLPVGHGLTAATWTMLGRARLAQNRAADAEAAFDEALDAWRVEYGEQNLGYLLAEALRGRAWMLQGRFADAERVFTRTYPMIAASKRKAEMEVAAEIRQWINEVYHELDRPEDATKYFARVDAAK